jgi:drug/metabolite transporter (DMT)-like permease
MDTYLLAMVAAFACAICNGTAAVLQKVSADKQKNVSTLDVSLLWRLLQDTPYIVGIALDLLGWLLTLVAVHFLPLFLVEAIIAFGIVVTAIIERLFRKQKISTKSYLNIGLIVIGLIILIITSNTNQATHISQLVKYLIIFSPLVVATLGFILVKGKRSINTILLAILSGIAFGGTSIGGRIFEFSHPLWQTIYRPLTLTIVVSGILGILLFSIALQRAKATIVNASATVSQTIVPTIIGIAFFGDTAKSGQWYLVIIGIALALVGVTFLSLSSES